MSAVTTRRLSRSYGPHAALTHVDLHVPVGSVYGLVGPNGSGKTTLLSIIAGLRRATSGQVHLGVDRRHVAVLPDTPHFDPWLTAREVVDLSRALVAPQLGPPAVDAALAQVGLAQAADRRCGGFSRGMLQRLGLAATLVGEPALVLLDEPASALDPAGRREVLDLVARLRGATTVLFSSHILGDVQQVCDTVGILREGRLLFQGPLDDLLVGRARPAYRVHVRERDEVVVAALRAERWVAAAEVTAPGVVDVEVRSCAEAEEHLVGALARTGVPIVSLGPRSVDLEAVFLELTA
jgi:ABC-2 type transport system ATP-binding protein